MIERQTTKLRKLLRAKTFLHMPSVYNVIGARLVQSLGFEAAKASFTVDGTCDWPENPAPKDEGAFMSGCNAYVEAVNARLEKLRREHLEGKSP